jgi:hypothetical protein
MITKFAIWALAIAVFATVLTFIVNKENRRVRKQKRDLRELPKLFNLEKEDEKNDTAGYKRK